MPGTTEPSHSAIVLNPDATIEERVVDLLAGGQHFPHAAPIDAKERHGVGGRDVGQRCKLLQEMK